jgi:hypothetical protein
MARAISSDEAEDEHVGDDGAGDLLGLALGATVRRLGVDSSDR